MNDSVGDMADKPASDIEEIEVTPEMIEAGALAGWMEPNPPNISRILAERIYRAMEAKRREIVHDQ